jgi:hypothetical protein
MGEELNPMSDPFRDYLSLYPFGTVPERPWWICGNPSGRTVGRRSDGVYVAVRYNEWGSRWVRGRDGSKQEDDIPIDPSATTMEAMAWVDEHHPLPAPPPIPGQVWSNTTIQKMVAAVEGVCVLWSNDAGGNYDGAAYRTRDGVWPPKYGYVLVHGPYSPWAPVGWKS